MDEKRQEKKQENSFKFGVYLVKEKSSTGKVISSELISERVFSADLYNPVVRYSVNIRTMIPKIIGSIQDVFQTKSNDLNFDDSYGYNSLNEYKRICELNKLDYFKLKMPPHSSRVYYSNGKTFQQSGVEFMFGLYINANPIVERNFYVDGYNPESRFSTDFDAVVTGVVEKLKAHLKQTDLNQMWDDYSIINVYDLNIQQVRDLSRERRDELLRRSGDYNFIEKIKVDYRQHQEFVA